MGTISEDEGIAAVEIARRALEDYIRIGARFEPFEYPKVFDEARGVFVTLNTYPDSNLRGCIGFPEPVAPLIDALIDSAISAASRDPRFPPVNEKELDSLTVEVSILTQPKKIEVNDPKEYAKKIKVGRDGLILRYRTYSGLLLPQVPVEYGWSSEEFLSHTCRKAGLPSDIWKAEKVELFAFSAQIWHEISPNGRVEGGELG